MEKQENIRHFGGLARSSNESKSKIKLNKAHEGERV